VEQVLTATANRSVEEQLAQLTAALQQKDDELIALHNRAANSTNSEAKRNAVSSRFHISKGGLGILTTRSSKPSTIVAFIGFIWKKIFGLQFSVVRKRL
jgi:hypothetical protein